jgi:hypothetical protein
MLRDASGPRRKIVAGVLESYPTPVYTAWLLREWTIKATLSVYDPPRPNQDVIEEMAIQSSDFVAEFGSASCDLFPIGGPFPPLPPRALCDSGSIPLTSPASYFRRIANKWPPSKTVHYSGPEQIRAEMDAVRAETERYIDKLRGALMERGLLSRSDRFRPQVKYQVVDYRTYQGVPLPEFR